MLCSTLEDEGLTDAEMQALRDAILAVVDRDTEALSAMGVDGDLYVWTRDYGSWPSVDLVLPPDGSFELNVIRRNDGSAHVAAPMWTTQEGRSDLTLEVEVVSVADTARAIILDLHVL